MAEFTTHTMRKLGGKNYQLWKYQVLDILTAHDIEGMIDGSNPKPGADADVKLQKAWKRDNSKAKHIITSSIDDDQMESILTCATAQEIWETLAAQHEQKSESNKVLLIQRFFDCNMASNDTVAKYITKIRNLVQALNDIGEKMSDEIVMAKILKGLPPKYSTFVTAWDSVDVSKQTLKALEERLIKQEGRMTAEDEEASAFVTAKFENKQKQKADDPDVKKCYSCGIPGHFAKNCRKRHRKRGKRRENSSNVNGAGKENRHGGTKDVDALVVEVDVNYTSSNDSQYDDDVRHVMQMNPEDSWLLDSGASRHVTFRRDWLTEFKPSSGEKVTLGDDDVCDITGEGTVNILKCVNGSWEQYRIEGVLYVPRLKKNLLSLGMCDFRGYEFNFKNGKVELSKDSKIILQGFMQPNKLYRLLIKVIAENQVNFTDYSFRTWHERLGHPNARTQSIMSKRMLVNGLKMEVDRDFDCETCKLAKAHRLPYKKGFISSPSTRPGELLHTDVCGPMKVDSLGGARYYVSFRDDETEYRWVYFIRHKSDVFEKFKELERKIFNKFNRAMSFIRSDNGKEYCNDNFHEYLISKGIEHQTTAPYAPEMNGKSERDNRTIIEAARTIMHTGKLPPFLWAEAVNAAVYLLNRRPTTRDPTTTPYEKWTGVKPSVHHLRVIGSAAFLYVQKQFRSKMELSGQKYILVGYRSGTLDVELYRLYDPVSRKIKESHDVSFSEKSRIHQSEHNQDLLQIKFNFQAVDDKEFAADDPLDILDQDDDDQPIENFEVRADEDVEENQNIPDSLLEEDLSPRVERKTYDLRNRSTINMPERYQINVAEYEEPLSYKQALCSKDAENWRAAIKEELDAHSKNNTWSIVEKPAGCNPIDSTWVFKLQPMKMGQVNRYKARLCARGFRQVHGIDFEETFSPVVRYDTLRIMLAIACREDYEIMQFDVKTAFLHGKLKENVYMNIPQGLKVSSAKSSGMGNAKNESGKFVCKLNKALYGLKQASRCWYETFAKFMYSYNFRVCESDKSLYMGMIDNSKVFIVLFVDDGLIMSASADAVKSVLKLLNQKFEITVSDPYTFVCVEIVRDRAEKKIFLHQTSYAKNIVNRFDMSEANKVCVPMENKTQLMNASVCDFNVPYREIIGSLMFLASVTRPDLSYSVNYLSRFLSAYDQTHWNAAKKILRYVIGTSNYGILYNGNFKHDNIIGYCDADFAADISTRRSTSGYVFQLAGAPVSWFSQRQSMVVLSTTESEYVAAAEAAKESVWINRLLSEIGYRCALGTKLFIDNQSAIRLIKNPEFHKRTKHIDTRFHFIREKYESGELIPEYVKSSEQLADVMTKALPRPTLEYLRNKMGIVHF